MVLLRIPVLKSLYATITSSSKAWKYHCLCTVSLKSIFLTTESNWFNKGVYRWITETGDPDRFAGGVLWKSCSEGLNIYIRWGKVVGAFCNFLYKISQTGHMPWVLGTFSSILENNSYKYFWLTVSVTHQYPTPSRVVTSWQFINLTENIMYVLQFI